MYFQELLTNFLTILGLTQTELIPEASNPIVWKQYSGLPSGIWQNIAYGNGTFVAVSVLGNAAYSKDGIKWTPVTITSQTANWMGITYANNVFCAISGALGSGEQVSAISKDGLTWQVGSLPQPTTWSSIAGGDGKFVAIVATWAESNFAAVSTDGLKWKQVTLPQVGVWNDVAYGNKRFVITSTTNIILSSTNGGTTWKVAKLPAVLSSLSEVDFGNGVFCAVSNCAGCQVGAVSQDGVTWQNTSLPVGGYWNTMVFADGIFLSTGAVFNGSDSVGAISSNGIDWTTTVLPSKEYWNTVASGNNTFVALADDNENKSAVGHLAKSDETM